MKAASSTVGIEVKMLIPSTPETLARSKSHRPAAWAASPTVMMRDMDCTQPRAMSRPYVMVE